MAEAAAVAAAAVAAELAARLSRQLHTAAAADEHTAGSIGGRHCSQGQGL
jgi:RNA 3'-terminal phosphate cyclase